ncbi:MAG: UDP-glucose 4-epimerase GalE [Oscillospiraceae bacterium]|nr:UDP-glucose 4-epimerase GalE [Oscillospiraceae bacterium]
MSILITGGTGYIGSHTVVELSKSISDKIIILDNLFNSDFSVIEKLQTITKKNIIFLKSDICDTNFLKHIFTKYKITSVIHFAGLKAVGESVEKPLLYYNNNIVGTISLLNVMKEFNCKKIVFSSSATVYGNPEHLPIKETAKLSTTNPYGYSKLIIENILTDIYNSDPSWSIAILRYFNPIGADKSGIIGENPSGIPNNLMPYIIKVATKQLDSLNIFGNNYDTIDGTGVRDYIHVSDLADGHIKALDYINNNNEIIKINLGTGKGYSVLQLVKTFIKVNNINIPYNIVDRRPGDIASCYANTELAKKVLNWESKKSLQDMCLDSYNFIKYNIV